jgi:DNA-binding NarL/FixJ family response regulator
MSSTECGKIRVLSVDDHPLMREGIVAMVNCQADMEVVAQASDGLEAVQQFRKWQPDVTLMDVQLPELSGIEALIAIRNEFPFARVVMLTTFQGDVDIARALSAGAQGYLLKNTAPTELAGIIRRAYAGKKQVPAEVAAHLAEHVGEEYLTSRERTVLEHVAEGQRNRDIGERLRISEETVKVHLKHIMGKLGARDRTQAMSIAVRRGIIRL